MKRRVVGIIVFVMCFSMFGVSALAATYSGFDHNVPTTYVKTQQAGSTVIVASGNKNSATTVANSASSSNSVVEASLFRHNEKTDSADLTYDAKVGTAGTTVTVSLSRDPSEECYFIHKATKYNATSTADYKSKAIIDDLTYIAFQY